MDNVRNFVDLVALGDNVAAKEELDKILSQKSFDALDARKQNIAGAIFGTTEQPEEIENDLDSAVAEVTYAENVEYDEDREQLDELSTGLINRYADKARESHNKAANKSDDARDKLAHTANPGARQNIQREISHANKIESKRSKGLEKVYNRKNPKEKSPYKIGDASQGNLFK